MPFHCSELHLTKLWVPNKDQSKQMSVVAEDPSLASGSPKVSPLRSPHFLSETRNPSNRRWIETLKIQTEEKEALNRVRQYKLEI